MRVGRVCVFPCNGIRRPASCVARLSGYIVDEDLLPGKILILCLPALLRGVEEDVLMVEKNPTIIIEGCEERCGSHILRLFGLLPAAMVYVPEIAEVADLEPGGSRQVLENSGQALAREVARRTAELAEGMLGEAGYLFERQHLQKEGFARLGEPCRGVAEALGYVRIAEGIYRPLAMPPLSGERAL